ncbi:patatin-like phospholipase family protein [Desulfonatronum lacustre]|uniref:patatin-like phospholipase family protein n=1 Tax=Desulfonatronum lacustre TaxID=66849 RepID=UPI0004B77A92|nr:patatin-like phospholipase family protein [Desulfonatronum lacustre]
MREGDLISRRRFLGGAVTVAASLPFSAMAGGRSGETPWSGLTVGLALGSGGANGLAHIPMLEVFDDLGVVPKMIAGTSIGAVIGALYASGLSGEDLRRLALDFASEDRHIMSTLIRGSAGLSLLDLIRPDLDNGGLLDSQGFLDFLREKVRVSTFEELAIPLMVVAADYWKREQVVLGQGPLIPAIKASMAVPGLFAPVELDGRLLVDGGTVNPLPFDLLHDRCDLVVAVDVSGGAAGPTEPAEPAEPAEDKPDALDSLFNTFEIMQRAITAEKLKNRAPHIFVRPETSGVRLLHFHKAEQIFTQSEPAAEALRAALREHLSGEPGS